MKVVLLILSIILCPLFVRAQYSTSDAGMWCTFSVKKSLNKKVYLAVDQELRLRNNYARLNLFYINLGIGYKFTKSFKAELVYRTIQKFQDDNTFSFRHRIMTDFMYKIKFNRFVLNSRLRYQGEVRDLYTSYGGNLAEHYLRLKAEIKYDNGGRFTPYVNAETRYQLYVPRGKGPYYNYAIHRMRYSAGFDYAFSETASLGLYYLIQNEFYINSPENNYITGVQFSKEF